MKLSMLKSISNSSFLVLIGALILSLNSCGLVSNIREQGDSKSWVVAGKESIRNGSIDSSTLLISPRAYAIKSVNKSVNVNTLEISSQIQRNHSEESYLEKHEKSTCKFIIKNNSTSGISKVGRQLHDNKGKLYPDFALKKTKDNLKSGKQSKEYSEANPKKNRAVFFALMSTLSFVLAFLMTVTGSDILVGIFFVAAVVLFIVSFILMVMKPNINVLQAALTILLNILNVNLGLIDLLAWGYMGY
jgi:hypothetical protein